MMSNLLHFLELIAATWYLSFVLTQKGGPFNLFARAREWREGSWHGRTKTAIYFPDDNGKPVFERFNDGLMDCIICLSPYVALALWLINSDYLTMPFAIAGFALWAHSYTGWIHFGGK